MPYITREDGEHFVIPSYRDVLTAKQKNQLKKDILILSQSYGEFITMQRKGAMSYEVAFSPETGYLLGESIWQHFKRPLDMIFCEAIPNTTDAILVIVKEGSVYLDGSFPIESIQEELIIFLTQQNNFEIYVYGDVPISQIPETGKFSFEAGAVKSFTVLDKPVFPTLPLLRIYQLQLVEPVLKANGIGVLPVKELITGLVILGLGYLLFQYFTTQKTQVVQEQAQVNPYQVYLHALNSPAPDQEIQKSADIIDVLYSMPGWSLAHARYSSGSFVSSVKSVGGTMDALSTWAQSVDFTLDIKTDGIYVTKNIGLVARPEPKNIYPVKQVIAKLIDRIASVYPGNRLRLGDFKNKGNFLDVSMTLTLDGVSPVLLNLLGEQFKDLPLVLQTITLDADRKSNLSGSITFEALGS